MDVIIMDMGDDVKGVSSSPGFEKKIELLSFSHGDPTSGRRDFKDMTVSKYLDTVTPVLHRAAMEAKVFPRVDIIIGRNDAGRVSVLLRYILKNVVISFSLRRAGLWGYVGGNSEAQLQQHQLGLLSRVKGNVTLLKRLSIDRHGPLRVQ